MEKEVKSVETKSWDSYLDWANQAPEFKQYKDVYEPIFVRFLDGVLGSFNDLNDFQKEILGKIDPENTSDFVLSPIELNIAFGKSPVEMFLFRKRGLQPDQRAELFEVIDVGAPARIFKNLNAQPSDFTPGSDVETIGAIIDEGIGFLNTRFRYSNKKTRFQAVWLQARERADDRTRSNVNVGRVLLASEIDGLLKNDKLVEMDEYQQINKTLYPTDSPFARPLRRDTHGTAIADLAFGADYDETNDRMSKLPLLAVQLPPAAVNDTSGTVSESYIVQAVRWLCAQSRRKKSKQGPSFQSVGKSQRSAEEKIVQPNLVINISYGVLAGQKDGGKFLEDQIQREVQNAKTEYGQTVHIVYAYGNNFGSKQVAQMDFKDAETHEINWQIQPDNPAPSFVEIRQLGHHQLVELSDDVAVELISPSGKTQIHQTPKAGNHIANNTGSAKLYHIPQRNPKGRPRQANYLAIAIAPTRAHEKTDVVEEAGEWVLRFKASRGAKLILQIQRGDTAPGMNGGGRQSYFEHESLYVDTPEGNASMVSVTNAGTNSSYTTASGVDTIYTVGSAAGFLDDLMPATYTSQGAHWSGGQPTESALVEVMLSRFGLQAAGTYSGTFTRVGGTSAAAALKSRSLALGGITQSRDTDGRHVNRLGDRVIDVPYPV